MSICLQYLICIASCLFIVVMMFMMFKEIRNLCKRIYDPIDKARLKEWKPPKDETLNAIKMLEQQEKNEAMERKIKEGRKWFIEDEGSRRAMEMLKTTNKSLRKEIFDVKKELHKVFSEKEKLESEIKILKTNMSKFEGESQ